MIAPTAFESLRLNGDRNIRSEPGRYENGGREEDEDKDVAPDADDVDGAACAADDGTIVVKALMRTA